MKRRFNSNQAVAFSAMFISFITLIIFIYQTHLMRVESHLSVMPRLDFNQVAHTTDSFAVFRYEIWNKGLGPAVIESIQVVVDDKRYDGNIQRFLEQQHPTFVQAATNKSVTNLGKGSTISEDEKIGLISLEIPVSRLSTVQSTATAFQDKTLFDIEIIYQSIYKERWKIRLNSTDSTPKAL